jgi:hypothetical protein
MLPTVRHSSVSPSNGIPRPDPFEVVAGAVPLHRVSSASGSQGHPQSSAFQLSARMLDDVRVGKRVVSPSVRPAMSAAAAA